MINKICKAIISKMIFIISAFVFLPAIPVSAHTAVIDIPEDISGYTAVPIDAQMYSLLRPDFGDIRLYDSGGNAVPYFIHTLRTPADGTAADKVYPLAKSDSFVKNGALYIDFALAGEYSSDIRASGMALVCGPGSFAVSAQINGSYDGLVWTYICDENIYSVETAEKLSISFSEPQKYTHYRIRLSNGRTVPQITGAELRFREDIPDGIKITSSCDIEYTAEEDGKNTVIRLPSAKNMIVDRFIIETDDMFSRSVSYPGGSQIIRRLDFDGETISDTEIKPGNTKIPENFTLNIYNGDDAPINIKGIKAVYYENYIIFKTPSPPCRLEFGDPELLPPVYDIENYKDEILSRPLAFSDFSDISVSETPEPGHRFNSRLIFNISVCAAAALLIALIVAALKRTGKSNG
ncbi:MAG: hypothetical protein J1F64_01730 [Oscillospiraceae bacterium]|nr:hypothetical protein [Oscillospiraceae bacterium]